ncbi:MAG: 50S ribosomal protein L20 [Phycisphaerae bacterium]|nr:50S ribosomal protein L20 [Phycisphaerae bacterium]
MGRATYGAARHRRKVRVLRASRSFRGAPRNHWKSAKIAVRRARLYSYRDRRRRKRDFRALWIIRLTAACRARGMQYSRFIFALTQMNVELNRKMLSEIAIHSPADFDAIVEQARNHMPAGSQAAA